MFVKMCKCTCGAGLVLDAWCSFSGVMAGCVLVRACVQHLWKGKKALQARYGSQRKYVRHRFNVALRTDCCWLCSCASCSDDGWLCACLQSLWKGKDPLQAKGAAKGLIGHSRTAAQMSLVAHELLLDALLAGMVAGCVLACVQHLLVWVEARSSLNQAQTHSQPSPENTLAS